MSPELRESLQGIADRRFELLAALPQKPAGLSWCSRHSSLVDRMIRVLYDDLKERIPNLPPVAVVATGGYGRSELAPYSDVDLTVIPSEEASSELDRAIRELFRSIQDAFNDLMGLQVGYAYRLVADAPGLDAKSRTGLMDMRLVAGSHELYRRLDHRLTDSFAAGEFVLAKILERDQMFAKFNDSPLVVEPNLKEGAGGLRSFQCANWLREAVGERAARPPGSYDTITRYRNLLHLVSGRTQDVLTRQRQESIAEMLGMDIYEMMSEVALAGDEIFSQYRRAREKLLESRFQLSPGLLAVQGEARTYGDPDGGAASVGIAVATQLGMRVTDIAFPSPPSIDGPAAMYALSTGEATIRNLDRCGLLKHVLPELTACKVLMPTDTVHQFTVFEHTLRAIRCLDSIEPNSFLGSVKSGITDLEPLYLAVLLHDVGKADRSRSHSVIGAEMARAVCLRWGLATGIRDMVEWLVKEHLTMAWFLRVRDMMNPQTIDEFALVVGGMERLRMLTLLTWADINAVAEGAWTTAQETFLKELYMRTEARIMMDQPLAPDPAVHRKRLLRQLKTEPKDEQEVRDFVDSLPAYYVTSTPPEIIRLHLDFARKAMAGESTVELFARPELNATEVTVCTLDQPGLLSRVLGVFYAFDLSVSEIRASTTATSPALVLDVFTVSFGGRPVPQATANQLASTLMTVMEGTAKIEDILSQRGKDPTRKQNVFSHTYIAGNPGILEIRAPRGRGMAYRFSRLIAGQGWNVVAARVGQWAGNATAAFYIQKPDGTALSESEVNEALRSVTPSLPGIEL